MTQQAIQSLVLRAVRDMIGSILVEVGLGTAKVYASRNWRSANDAAIVAMGG
jgi:precorrin-6B methylase 2